MGLCVTKATSKNEPIEELDIATVDPMAKKAGKEFPYFSDSVFKISGESL